MEITTLITGLIVILIYFAPTLTAKRKNLDSIDGRFILNLLIGWTVIGRLILFIIVVSKDDKKKINSKN